MSFKTRFSEEERKQLSRKIRERYPGRYPIICEPAPGSDLKLDKIKFLCPEKFRFSEFQIAVRQKIGNLKSHEAIYMFIGNSLVPSNSTIASTYEKYKEDDGLLYVVFDKQSTFG